MAAVVGTVLSAVNQGYVVLAGDAGVGTWVRIAVNYLVPFCMARIHVREHRFLSARREHRGPANPTLA